MVEWYDIDRVKTRWESSFSQIIHIRAYAVEEKSLKQERMNLIKFSDQRLQIQTYKFVERATWAMR